MKRTVLLAGAAALAIVGLPAPLAAAAVNRSSEAKQNSFSVVDSIESTRLVDPAPPDARRRLHAVKISPDHRWYAFVTRRGDLLTGTNVYSLNVIEASEIDEYLNAPDVHTMPARRTCLEWSTKTADSPIRLLQWAGPRTLAFLGSPAGGPAQVYAFDVGSRQLTALTDEIDGVFAFELSQKHRKLFYSTFWIPEQAREEQYAYIVRSEFVGDLLKPESRRLAARQITYKIVDLETRAALTAKVPPHPEPAVAEGSLLLSPDARWAIAYAPVARIPKHWFEYESARPFADAVSCDRTDDSACGMDDAFGQPVTWFGRLLIVDMQRGTWHELLNAPYEPGAGLMVWSPDGNTVHLARSPLPPDGGKKKEDLGRRAHREGALDIRVSSSGRPASINVLTDASTETITAGLPRLRVTVAEGMNQPPDLIATDAVSGRRKIITDLNPAFRRVEWGREEIFRWSDRYGRTFEGGLVYPPAFRDGERYPVVLQTYGFDASEFLIDGPNGLTTAFAARPLASAGMMVLQMPFHFAGDDGDKATCYERDGENPRFVAMMEGAIDALDRAGLIDRERVGIIGFSRTGMQVHYAITFSEYSVTAATIADSAAATPLSYVTWYGSAFPGMREWESNALMGSSFWGNGVQSWLERSPIFHLDRISAALRYEFMGTRAIPENWDTFALLKRHNRPVEMVHLPSASHVVQAPHERLASQQGNVDWFSFWLQGNRNDTDARTKEQFSRWQVLRQRREVVLAERARSQAVERSVAALTSECRMAVAGGEFN